jgi:hypothetical protein
MASTTLPRLNSRELDKKAGKRERECTGGREGEREGERGKEIERERG